MNLNLKLHLKVLHYDKVWTCVYNWKKSPPYSSLSNLKTAFKDELDLIYRNLVWYYSKSHRSSQGVNTSQFFRVLRVLISILKGWSGGIGLELRVCFSLTFKIKSLSDNISCVGTCFPLTSIGTLLVDDEVGLKISWSSWPDIKLKRNCQCFCKWLRSYPYKSVL